MRNQLLFILSGLMATGLTAMGATREVTLRSNGTSADVAVTVIDNKLATADEENTIQTSLLLNSELRGSVEDAGWYFPDSLTHKHRQAMDGLMLTQGWSRYDIPAAIDGRYTEVESELEIGPSIGGIVKSRWKGKPMKDVAVLTLAPSMGYVGEAITDEKGEFVFTDKDFPDGTRFIFQALNEKGGNEGNFDIIPAKYPSVAPIKSIYSSKDKSQIEEMADYDWRITHSDAIMLGEVLVVQKKQSDYENPIELMARGEVSYKDIEDKNLRTVEDVLRTIPGIVVYERKAFYQGRPVSFWVDNLPWEPISGLPQSSDYVASPGKLLNASRLFRGYHSTSIRLPHTSKGIIETPLGEIDQVLPVDFIKKIQYFPPTASKLLSPWTEGGIIMITTKDGTEKVSRPDWRMRYATPLGYQRSKTFYTPKYELMADYELNNRPTLYWIPSAKVDRFGNLSMPIPASVESCTLIAEGIDTDGHPVRLTKSM